MTLKSYHQGESVLIVGAPMINEYGQLKSQAIVEIASRATEAFFVANSLKLDDMVSCYGVTWMQLSTIVEMHASLHPWERVHTMMWNACRVGRVFRWDFQAVREDEQPAMTGAQFFALVDVKTRRICRDEAILDAVTGTEGCRTVTASSRPPEPMSSYENAGTRSIFPSWIDENGHVNNIRYADMCYDALPEAERRNIGSVRRLEIYYQKELRMGDKVVLKRCCCDNQLDIIGLTDEMQEPVVRMKMFTSFDQK